MGGFWKQSVYKITRGSGKSKYYNIFLKIFLKYSKHLRSVKPAECNRHAEYMKFHKAMLKSRPLAAIAQKLFGGKKFTKAK